MARLLLVDDEPTQMKFWLLGLAGTGHQLETAETAEQAVEHLTAAAPDILVMDLRLPELKDGLTVLRKAAEHGSTKVLVLSGWPQDLESLPERKLAHKILLKPVKLPALLREIAELTSAAAG